MARCSLHIRHMYSLFNAIYNMRLFSLSLFLATGLINCRGKSFYTINNSDSLQVVHDQAGNVTASGSGNEKFNSDVKRPSTVILDFLYFEGHLFATCTELSPTKSLVLAAKINPGQGFFYRIPRCWMILCRISNDMFSWLSGKRLQLLPDLCFRYWPRMATIRCSNFLIPDAVAVAVFTISTVKMCPKASSLSTMMSMHAIMTLVIVRMRSSSASMGS